MFNPFKKKKRAEAETLSHPPFPLLTWTEYDYWEGTACLPAWAGFQSRGGPYGAEDRKAPSDGSAAINVSPPDPAKSRILSEAQCRGFLFQRDHGEEVVTSVLQALGPFYRQLKATWGFADEMPDVASPEQFRQMIGLHQIHVHPYLRDGLCYVGLEFGCDWDEEHGLG